MQNEEKSATWSTYQKAWSDVSASERQDLLNRSVSADCVYTDPLVQCTGREELIAYIRQFRQSMPGGSFKNQKFVEHHGESLAEWTLYDAGGAAPQSGASHARFGEDGRITRVTGFFDIPG